MIAASMQQGRDRAALRRARSRANHRVAFMAHAIAFGMTVLLIWVGASFFVAVIVGLAWGIGLALHGFFGVVAPSLRERWVQEELDPQIRASVRHERAVLGGDHARQMHRLSAAVAHEIRNPITAAKSWVQQMGEDPAAPENVAYARVAIEELDRVERSIAHLLRFAREQEITLAPTRLGSAVRSALDNMEEQLSGIDVALALSEDDAMRGDDEALRRVMINLLSNARDAIAERAPAAPRIAIESGRSLAGDELWLRVRDNGGGVDAETAAAMFDPFHTTKPQGTGLGLAICRRIVEAHSGRIELTERVEACEITLTFPAEVAG